MNKKYELTTTERMQRHWLISCSSFSYSNLQDEKKYSHSILNMVIPEKATNVDRLITTTTKTH